MHLNNLFFRHTPRNVDAFFLKIDCWDQAVLLVCAWEKEDLPERRQKMKEKARRDLDAGSFQSDLLLLLQCILFIIQEFL